MSMALTNEVRALRKLVDEQAVTIAGLQGTVAGLQVRLDALARQGARGTIKPTFGDVPKDQRAVANG